MNMSKQFLLLMLAAMALAGCAAVPSQQNALPLETRASHDQGVISFNDQTPVVKGPELLLVNAGSFRMGNLQTNGAGNEGPVRSVVIERPFAAGRYEVTVAEFRRFVDATGYVTDAEKGGTCYTYNRSRQWVWQAGTDWRKPGFSQEDNHPVVCVSWRDAMAYVTWLSDVTGEPYRLPTEAEWEYLARAGTTTPWFWGGKQDCKRANCCTGTLWLNKQTRSVGSYSANPFGFHDTAGNVWEWTGSAYSERLSGYETKLAMAEVDSLPRVLRGGSWYRFEPFTRSSTRGGNWPQERFSDVGFRVVREVSDALVRELRSAPLTALNAPGR